MPDKAADIYPSGENSHPDYRTPLLPKVHSLVFPSASPKTFVSINFQLKV